MTATRFALLMSAFREQLALAAHFAALEDKDVFIRGRELPRRHARRLLGYLARRARRPSRTTAAA